MRFETGRMVEMAGVRVPRYLSPDQAIWDQPPFKELLENQGIFPDQAFLTTLGKIKFLRAVVLRRERFWEEVMSNHSKQYKVEGVMQVALEGLSEDFLHLDTVEYMDQRVGEYLEQYPNSRVYLWHCWRTGADGDFDEMGRRRGTEGQRVLPIETYAASVARWLPLELAYLEGEEVVFGLARLT